MFAKGGNPPNGAPEDIGCYTASAARLGDGARSAHSPVHGPSAGAATTSLSFIEDEAQQPRDRDFPRCYHNPGNFTRRERAFELARRHGVSAINIALTSEELRWLDLGEERPC